MPLLLVISTSLSNEDTILSTGYALFPKGLNFFAYQYIFIQGSGLLKAYGITIFVTVVGTILGLLITTMFAYSIARKDFKLRKIFAFYIFFTMLFSGGTVPTYIVVAHFLHLKDSLFALILPYLILPFNVILMRSFFLTVPEAMLESAKIDGAREWTTFFKIVIPVSIPGIATIGLFTALMYWNDWFQSFLYIDNANKVPVQLFLQRIMSTVELLKNVDNAALKGLNLPAEGTRMAMCVLAIGPIILLFPFLQRFFVKGLTVGSIKG